VKSLARWCVRHRRTVIFLWIAILVATSLIKGVVGTHYSDSFSMHGTESADAYNLLAKASPKVSGDRDQIVFEVKGAGRTVESPAVVAKVNAMLADVKKLPHVSVIVSPYSPFGAFQISQDRTIAYATVTFDVQAQKVSTKEATTFVATVQKYSSPALTVAVEGQVAKMAAKPSLGGAGFGIIAALIVLLVVFASLAAALLPLLSAVVALGSASALVGILTHVLSIPSFAPELVSLIGLGVGVDYALFIVTRHRQGLLEGRDVEDSIANAVNTSGRAVLFAGIIVCIALLGMFALGVSFLNGLAIGALIGVLFTMAAALTLLPAALSFLGPRILSRKQKISLAINGPRPAGQTNTGFWSRWASFVDRRPIVPAVLALAIIGALTLPFFSMQLGLADSGSDPVGTTTRTAYDLLAEGFGPGYNGQIQLVAATHDTAAMTEVAKYVAATDGVAHVSGPLALGSPANPVEVINVIPTTAPQDSKTADRRECSTTRHSDVDGGLGVHVLVGGFTAIAIDFSNTLSSKLPIFISLVVLLSFLLLAVVFKSVVIPLVSAVMNLLSIGAAFGILVAVFQWGWLGSLFGATRTGPVESFLPVMMFAILFGLSMD
jgi:RND superfamily putative drug exporter